MYVISVVETDRYASSMSVHNESTNNLQEAYDRKRAIVRRAIEHYGWEVMNNTDFATWLKDAKHPDRLAFVQITTCFPVKKSDLK